MSKKLIAISLAIMLIGLFSTAAFAGVEGSFDFTLEMEPQFDEFQFLDYDHWRTFEEVTKFDYDFVGELDLDVTLSGLTWGNKMRFGIAGIEHYITSINTTLGALTIQDEFVFAAPYGRVEEVWLRSQHELLFLGKVKLMQEPYELASDNYCVDFFAGSSDLESDVTGTTYSSATTVYHECGSASDMGDLIDEIDANDGKVIGSGYYEYLADPSGVLAGLTGSSDSVDLSTQLAEVDVDNAATLEIITKPIWFRLCKQNKEKKRVTAELTLAGLSIENLLLFEDVNFTHPMKQPKQTSSYQFGNLLTITGETVSGIELVSKTGYNVDWQELIIEAPHDKITDKLLPIEFPVGNYIKGESWTETVQTGYMKEVVEINNVSFGPINGRNIFVMNYTRGATSFTFENYVVAGYTVGNWLNAKAYFMSTDPLSLAFNDNYFTVTTNFGSIVWWDADADFSPDASDWVHLIFPLDLQNTHFDILLTVEPGTGLYDTVLEAEIPISYPEQIGTLDITAEWGTDAYTEEFGFEDIEFGISKEYGEHNTFDMSATFDEHRLIEAELGVGVTFSL